MMDDVRNTRGHLDWFNMCIGSYITVERCAICFSTWVQPGADVGGVGDKPLPFSKQ